ncbi:unnamed protein product [Spirodela intermedia]|uniref:Uncharacterized protein n=1 Tax=Spirodela intermedia TaxID=51605 RepID=A0A7I8KB94_SPIIN|nr:unnamed protein product [Spirodela intermedia]
MAMPSGNSVIPRKMQFSNGGDAHAQRQWFPDERDGFIYWLKGEFAAANAIIDSLCEHLRTTSEPGEYDMVVGCIQQRRCNWTPVLYLQQYFSVAEINLALQQVAWRKQPRHFDQPKPVEKDFKKQTFGYRQVQKLENMRENHSSSAQYLSPVAKAQKTEEESTKREEVKQKTEVQVLHGNALSVLPENDAGQDATPNQEGTQKSVPIPKVFEFNELCNGKTVNVVDGLKLYDDLFENSEISTLVAAANEWRISGQKGEFQGE